MHLYNKFSAIFIVSGCTKYLTFPTVRKTYYFIALNSSTSLCTYTLSCLHILHLYLDITKMLNPKVPKETISLLVALR